MNVITKISVPVIISLITAAAIIAAALYFKGTQYENAWLYIFGVGITLSLLVEAFWKKK